MSIFKAFRLGFGSLFEPQVLLMMLLVPLMMLVVWLAVFYFVVWDLLLGLVQQTLGFSLVNQLIATIGLTPGEAFITGVVIVLAVLLFFPLLYISTVMMISLFAMPIIVKTIQAKHYPHIKKAAASGVGSIFNTVIHTFLFIVFYILLSPLYLVPGLQIVLPVLLTAGYNRHIFAYDAVAEFLEQKQIKQFKKQNRTDLYLIGLFTALLIYLPLASFVMPIWGAAAFTHYSLAKIQEAA